MFSTKQSIHSFFAEDIMPYNPQNKQTKVGRQCPGIVNLSSSSRRFIAAPCRIPIPTLSVVLPSKNPSLHLQHFFFFHPWQPSSHDDVIHANI
jgi:hypothetical protein